MRNHWHTILGIQHLVHNHESMYDPKCRACQSPVIRTDDEELIRQVETEIQRKLERDRVSEQAADRDFLDELGYTDLME